MSKPKRPVLLVATSDQHTGSTVGICPPEGVKLDDGGRYLPSLPQQWLWDKWENDFWPYMADIRRKAKADLWLAFVGDMVDGDHHHTHQIISRNPDAQHYVASRVFKLPLKLKPDRVFVVRGTEAHTGSGGSAEEAIAQMLNAEKDAETHTWSRWRLRLEAHGVLMDFQHHGKVGPQPWTKQNVVNANAAKIFYEYAVRGWRHPDIAVRAHMHQWADSGEAQPVRVIQLPSWQLKTGFVHKVAPESIADVGGVGILIQPDGSWEIKKKLYVPNLPEVVK